MNEELYDLAFQVRQLKPWKKLTENDFFAIQYKNKRYYCSVTGGMGEHFAVIAYRNLNFVSYLMEIPEYMTQLELQHSQDCVMCSYESKSLLPADQLSDVTDYCKSRGLSLRGKNSWPLFSDYKPGYYPWKCGKADQAVLILALKATIRYLSVLDTADEPELSYNALPMFAENGSISTVRYAPFRYAHFKPYAYFDELTKHRFKIRSGDEWAMQFVMLPQYVQDDENKAPRLPVALIIVNTENGLVVDVILCKGFGDEDELRSHLAKTIIASGLPGTVLFTDSRTQCYLEDLFWDIGVETHFEADIPELSDAVANIAGNPDDDIPEDPADLIAEMCELLENEDALAQVPTAVLSDLAGASDMFPEDIIAGIRRELARRGN